MASHDIVTQTRKNGRAAYEKIPFYGKNRDRILRLASNGAARARLVTKRPAQRPATVRVTVAMTAPRRFVKAKLVTVDDIDNFKRVKRVAPGGPFVKIAESKFKAGVAKLLGERGTFKDWGGELRDLSSTRVKVGREAPRGRVRVQGAGRGRKAHAGEAWQERRPDPAPLSLPGGGLLRAVLERDRRLGLGTDASSSRS